MTASLLSGKALAFALLVSVCCELSIACDSQCLLHKKALVLINEFRTAEGKTALRSDPKAMLSNAVDHSQKMLSGALGFDHQDLSTATSKVGCETFISGENIAWFSGNTDNAPSRCVELWISSPGHRENILRDNDFTVTGIVGDSTKVYCTQTCGQDQAGPQSPRSGKCELIADESSGNSSPASPPTSAPPQTTTTESSPQEVTTEANPENPTTEASPQQTETKATTSTTPEAKEIGPQPEQKSMEYMHGADKETTAKHDCLCGNDKCTHDYQRCAGAPGMPYIEYKGCCSPDMECVESSDAWGSFCLPRDPHQVSRILDGAIKKKKSKGSGSGTPIGSINNLYVGKSSVHTYFLPAKKSNSGYQDEDDKHFSITNRVVIFEEECTYNADGSTDRCILCQKDSEPPVCVDPSTANDGGD